MSNHILDYWDEQAKKFGASHVASWGDNFAIDLEIKTIGQYINPGDEILDVGCANGFSAVHHLDKKIRSMVGVDFSEHMIAEANKIRESLETDCDLHFEVGDARDLRFEDNTFDVVYTTRTLINLPTWEDQKQAISECVRVCKTGGKIVLSESFWEPLVLLNSLRALKSLPPLEEHDFNRYFKKRKLEEFLKSIDLEYDVIEFSSVYYLGSRFLRELVTNPSDYPGYSNPINKIFHEIGQEYFGGGFGIQQAYVITK